MAGELTLSGSTFCSSESEIESAVEALVLPAVTDTIHAIPYRGGVLVFAVIRA